MTDDNQIPGGGPVPEFDDVVDFLAKRATKPCPSCGYHRWVLSAPVKGKVGIVSSGMVGVHVSSGQTLTHGVPMVLTTCVKCAFVKMHGLFEISKWIETGKPEFKDE